jgi:hypothetical protein
MKVFNEFGTCRRPCWSMANLLTILVSYTLHIVVQCERIAINKDNFAHVCSGIFASADVFFGSLPSNITGKIHYLLLAM